MKWGVVPYTTLLPRGICEKRTRWSITVALTGTWRVLLTTPGRTGQGMSCRGRGVNGCRHRGFRLVRLP